jgi:hypothetical protein
MHNPETNLGMGCSSEKLPGHTTIQRTQVLQRIQTIQVIQTQLEIHVTLQDCSPPVAAHPGFGVGEGCAATGGTALAHAKTSSELP